MQGLVARLKRHYHDCAAGINYNDDDSADSDISQPNIQLLPQKRVSNISLAPKQRNRNRQISLTMLYIHQQLRKSPLISK